MDIAAQIQKLRDTPREQLDPIEAQLLEDNQRSNDKIQEIDSALQILDQQRQRLLADRQRQVGIADFTILKALTLHEARTVKPAKSKRKS